MGCKRWFSRELVLSRSNQTFGTLCSRIKPSRITVGPHREPWNVLTDHIQRPLMPLQRQTIGLNLFLHQQVSVLCKKPSRYHPYRHGTNQIKTHFWNPLCNLPPPPHRGRLRPQKTTTPLGIWNLKRLASGARAASSEIWSFLTDFLDTFSSFEKVKIRNKWGNWNPF